MIIEIPLIGGVNSVTDLEDVGTGFVEFNNLSDPQTFKGKGKLTKWRGFGAETVITNVANMARCIFWVQPTGSGTNDHLFFGYSADNKTAFVMDNAFAPILTNSALFLWNEILGENGGDADGKLFTNNYSTDTRIYNNGHFIRFANGHSDKPKLLYWLNGDRDFFWSEEGWSTKFSIDYSYPRKINEDSVVYDTYNSGWFTAYGLGYQVSTHDLTSNTYYYKCSYVYDGNQESPLDTVVGDTSWGTTLTESVPNLTIDINVGYDLVGFNHRITGINIYRANRFEGAYYKIASVSTLYNDPNIQTVTDAQAQYSFYASGAKFVDHTLDGGILVSNMFDTFHQLGEGQDPNGQREYEIYENIGQIIGLGTGTGGFGGAILSLDDTCWRINGKNETYTTTNGTDPGQTTPHAYIRYDESALAYEPKSGGADAFNTNNSGGPLEWTFDECGGDFYSNYGIDESGGGTARLTTYSSGYDGEPFSGDAPNATTSLTLQANTTYVLSTYITYFSNGDQVKIGIGLSDDHQDANFEVAELVNMVGLGDSTPHGLSLQSKRYFQITFNTGSVTSCFLKIRVARASSTNAKLYLDKFRLYRVKADCTRNTFFGGKDVIVSNSLNLGHKDSHKGNVYQLGYTQIGTSLCERGWIKANARNAILSYHGEDFPYNLDFAGGSKTLIINDNYMWRGEAPNQILNFWDKGLQPGPTHPYGDTKNVVNYKYATISSGRQFVANVKLDPDGASEAHKNWIIFSELNQHDVLPITNFIQLNDKQGGEITGIEQILGDIVVFMERGIYRLSIPSYNPSEWSLAEAYENIGCEAPDTIVSWNGGVFFMAKDNYYFLDSNFNLSPVGDPIRNEIASFPTDSFAIIDDVHNRLILKPAFPDSWAVTSPQWIYDLKESHWRQERMGGSVLNSDWVYIHGYFKDADGVIRFWDKNSTSDVGVRRVYTFGDDLDMIQSSSKASLKTGLIRIADSGNTRMIRRLNFRGGVITYDENGDPIANNLTFVLYNEDGAMIWNTIVSAPVSGNLSLKVSARAELVQLKVLTQSPLSETVIERLALEID